ncbi:hypothetical protein [Synechococcus sp. PCC 7336]|uniref:hypothetical protein n=1 Tax=Synechococcus sp. PCC 7336 TaxID=195250 RepID=UPI00034DCB97|nr:hypothetical protein [Synechococcus sp. PCC 7336]
MTQMGAYCKAYPLKQLQQFEHWPRPLNFMRKETQTIDGRERETQRKLSDEDVLYLQENYVVTDGIFSNQNVVFEAVTDEWKDFCDRILGFEIPAYTRGAMMAEDRM